MHHEGIELRSLRLDGYATRCRYKDRKVYFEVRLMATLINHISVFWTSFNSLKYIPSFILNINGFGSSQQQQPTPTRLHHH